MRQFASALIGAVAFIAIVTTPGAEASFPCADLNFDSSVDSLDSLLVLQLTAGLLTLEELFGETEVERAFPIADVNNDGVINSLDALFILQYSAGLLETLPECYLGPGPS